VSTSGAGAAPEADDRADSGRVSRLHLPDPVVDEALVARCQASFAVLPRDSAFSHVTAAQLLGLPLSYAVEDDLRLHAIRPIAQAQTRIDGIVGHRFHHPREMVEIRGMRVVGPADTWVDMGELVGRGKPVGLDDLIILGDACATRLGAVEPLRAALRRRVRPRGKRALQEALELIRFGSASPMETVVRIMLVRAGLPAPLLNEPVHSADGSGRLLGFGDLVWKIDRRGKRPVMVIGEYQGEDFHSSRDQREHDEGRRLGFERDGWTVQEIWKSDVTGDLARRGLVERMAWSLRVPIDNLRFSEIGPRFFSRHAIELAIQRGMGR
jgi:hypothetical protein